MKVCVEPQCPELTDETRCEKHRLEKRRREDRRRVRTQNYGDAQWRKTRAAFLRLHPVCQDPEGCIKRATDVHHLDGLGHAGPKGHDFGNLEALCHSHHSRRTAKEKPAGWNTSGVGWPE